MMLKLKRIKNGIGSLHAGAQLNRLSAFYDTRMMQHECGQKPLNISTKPVLFTHDERVQPKLETVVYGFNQDQ